MSGKLKTIRTRIKAVIETQQITRAMKMVSAAKLRRAQDAIWQMRPYANKLNEILNNVLENVGVDLEIKYAEEREIKNVLLVLITSDRGLCGSFNSNLIKLTNRLLNGQYAQHRTTGNVRLLCIGKRGYDYFSRRDIFVKRRNISVISDYVQLLQKLEFNKVMDAAQYVLSGFLSEEFDKVELIYDQFKNAATQYFVNEQFLPVLKFDDKSKKQESKPRPDYIFEPSQQEIVDVLIPFILKTHFYRAVLESNASEHGARMTAMDKATENARELLRELRIFYNRARQEVITKEISEIVGGANALAER